jgi:hypothetical protein
MDPAPADPGYQAGSSAGSGTVETAKQEAAGVADVARDAAGGVVDVAKSEASHVAQDVKMNARQLLTQTKGELAEQAATQQRRVADGLWSISDELSAMANASQDGGVATDLVRQAADRSSAVAAWLENRDPGSLLDEMKSFARRRPGTFLLLAAGAGVLAGRLGRGMAENAAAEASDTTGATPRDGSYRNAAASRAGSYPAAGGAVPPPPVNLPGPQTTTAGYGSGSANAMPGTAVPGNAMPGNAMPGTGYDQGVGYDAGTAAGADGSPAAYPDPAGYAESAAYPEAEGATTPYPEAEGATTPYPEADTGRAKAHGDPLAGSLDPDNPDTPEYGGPR